MIKHLYHLKYAHISMFIERCAVIIIFGAVVFSTIAIPYGLLLLVITNG